jgi:hypothetical protein
LRAGATKEPAQRHGKLFKVSMNLHASNGEKDE